MDNYSPEKWIWTEADFEQMGWHDVHIHAFAFETHSVALDIDYMFRWVDPAPDERSYKFWMSPSTLVFDGVIDLRLNLEPHGVPIIMGVTRSAPKDVSGSPLTWLWSFDCLDGGIAFRASGFRQFTRRRPVLASSQVFSHLERGGISLSQVAPDAPLA